MAPIWPGTTRIASGQITQIIPEKKIYYVNLFGENAQVEAKVADVGIDVPLDRNDEVLLVYHRPAVGWMILCRIRKPVYKDLKEADAETSLAEIMAQEERALTDDPQPDTSPPFSEDEEPSIVGDVMAQSRTSGSFFKIFSDGTIVNWVSDTLLLALLKAKSALSAIVRQIRLKVVPGFGFEIGPDDRTKLPDGQPAPDSDPKINLRMFLSSQPKDPKDQDFFLEAGGLRSADDPKKGESNVSYQPMGDDASMTIRRGLRMRFRDYAILEADNERKEVRITMAKEGETTGLYQIRFNQDEAVLSWGGDEAAGEQQFISFNRYGLFLKAKMIGIAGPWAMWDPAKTANFTQADPYGNDVSNVSQDAIVCEWYTGARGPGIRIDKSIYFGQKAEPAVLESFVTSQYQKDIVQTIAVHTHTVQVNQATGSGSALPSTELTSQLPTSVGTLIGNLNDYLSVKV